MAGKIRLTWRDRNGDEDGHRVYRSDTPTDVNNLPTPIADLPPNTTVYDDNTVTEGNFYYYRTSAYRGDIEKVSAELAAEAVEAILGPGPKTLLAGDMIDGFFGEVAVTELFTGDELATAIGLTKGFSQHSTEPWLKFAKDGEIIYIAKKPYRHSVSWNNINYVNAVYDDVNAPIVSAGGFDMKVTLMTGSDTDPESGAGGEWNRLMYRVHQDVPTDQVGGNWASYTDADIIVTAGNGRVTWTQERHSINSTSHVGRGLASLSYFYLYDSNSLTSAYGWRPALRLIV